MKRKIVTLLVTVAMAGALLAGPALAQDHYNHHDSHWWSFHRPSYAYNPRGAYAYNNNPRYWSGPGYSYSPMMRPPSSHWRLINGHWRWVRG